MTGEYDYIVVGAGSGGCVAGGRLAGEFGQSVLMLEGGGSDNTPLISWPAATFKMLFGGHRAVKMYVSTPQQSMGGRRVVLPQGNVLGGGSSINVMTYVRGSRDDFADWNAATGTDLWGWEHMLAHYVRQEGNRTRGGPFHGQTGPLAVTDQTYSVPGDALFVKTMEAMGLPFCDDFTTGEMRGAGYLLASMGEGRRCNAARAFLRSVPAACRPDLVLGARVNRLVFDGKRVVGVQYAWKGQSIETCARKGVILTAGALATPKLMMVSGLGPRAELKRHGISVIADLPGVGANLQDHQMVLLPFHTQGNHGYYGKDKGIALVGSVLRYLVSRTGPVAATGSSTVGFWNLSGTGAEPESQLYCLHSILPGLGIDPDRPGLTLMGSLLRPRASGTVRLASVDPGEDPLVDLNWMSDAEDRALLLRIFRFLQRAAATEPLAGIIDRASQPALELAGDEEILSYIGSTSSSNYHVCGTARMGRANDPMAVLDPQLSVRGIDGLHVMDASAMPNVIRANTNATVMAIADRGVDMLMGRA